MSNEPETVKTAKKTRATFAVSPPANKEAEESLKFSLTKSYQGAPAGTLVEKIGEREKINNRWIQCIRLDDGTEAVIPENQLWGPITKT